MTAMLEVRNLYKIYGPSPQSALTAIRSGAAGHDVFTSSGHVVAVNDVSFSVSKGEIFTIMGLSGSGKSTLVRCINRIIEPTAGSVLVDGVNVVEKSAEQLRALRRRRIAMVFQSFALLPHKSVRDNVELGLMIRGEPEAERRRKSDAALDRVGLSGWSDRRPDNLSGGMKQRVGLARALASDPDILLMDEPFSALDPLIRSELQHELLKLQRDINKTIVFITHDFHEAVRLSDQLAVMRDGKFVQVGTPHDIVLRPADAYVANFSRELDRTRILRAGDVTHMRVPVLQQSAPAIAVLDAMRGAGKPHAILVDAEHRPAGFAARGSLEHGADLAGRVGADMSVGVAATVPASAPMTRLFGLANDGRPLAVVDEAGAVIGALDASDIAFQLADVSRDADERSSRAGGRGAGAVSSGGGHQ